MYLAEALALGSMTLKQTMRRTFNSDFGEAVGGCAMGMVMKAIGVARNGAEVVRIGGEFYAPALLERFPILNQTISSIQEIMSYTLNPKAGEPYLSKLVGTHCAHVPLGRYIATLNDQGKTIPQILEWLEPYEREHYEKHPEDIPVDPPADQLSTPKAAHEAAVAAFQAKMLANAGPLTTGTVTVAVDSAGVNLKPGDIIKATLTAKLTANAGLAYFKTPFGLMYGLTKAAMPDDTKTIQAALDAIEKHNKTGPLVTV